MDGNKCNLTEHHLTTEYSHEFVDNQTNEKGKLIIERCPCHTKAVEGVIKLVTEASAPDCEKKKRLFHSNKTCVQTQNHKVCNQITI